MKLLLSSAGIRTQELADSLTQLVGKELSDINMAVVNEAAAVEPGDKTWFFNELNDLRKYVGGEIDFVDLLALSIDEVAERIAFADVIYVVGGNPDYLLYLYKQVGFDQLLQDKLLNEKVYVGSSAGSMVLGHRGSTNEYQEFYGEDRNFGTTDYLGIVDFVIKPHFESPDLPKNHPDILRQASIAEQQTIYAIQDDQAIVVQDSEVSFIGGDIFKVEKE
jgi:dipeptidase E